MQLQASDIWDGLDRAVVKGMVVQEGDRFRLGESVRDYAREQVSGEDDARTRNRHFSFFAEMAIDTEHRVRGPKQRFWLNAFQNESENLRAALDWAFHNADLFAAGQEMLYNVTPFYFIRGAFAEALRWYEIALSLPVSSDHDLRSRLFRRAGLMALYNDDAQSKLWLQTALEEARMSGVEATIADALYSYGNYLHVHRRFDESLPYLLESLQQFRKLHDVYGMGFALARLGTTAFLTGDFDKARAHFNECLAVRTESEDTRGIGASFALLSALAMQQGEVAQAKGLCREALALFAELGTELDFADSLLVAAWIGALENKPQIAATLIGFSDTVSQNHNVRRDPAELEDYRRANEETRRRLDAEMFHEKWSAGRNLNVAQALELAKQVL